jgi:hypothetical protein
MYVRFAPRADKIAGVSVGPLCAMSGLMHRSKIIPSLALDYQNL